MLRVSGILVLTMACVATAIGQVASVPDAWIGTWAQSTQESDASDGELLEIATSSGYLKIASSGVTSKGSSFRQELDLNLDGTETVSPEGARLSLRRIDDLTLDVILSVNNKAFGNHVENIHFELAADGNSLRETRTHTERVVVPDGLDPTTGKLIKTSRSDLVFDKVLFIPSAGTVVFKFIERLSIPFGCHHPA